MPVRKFAVLLGIAVLSMPAYAQKGLGKAVETAVQRQVVNRAQLPTFRDGMRNLVTRRLGGLPVVKGVSQTAGKQVVLHPTASLLHFESSLRAPKTSVVPEFPRIVGGRHDQRADGFYSVAAPGSGDIAAIALPAYALIKQVAIAQSATLEDRKVFLQMAESLDNGFAMSEEGNWNLVRGYSFEQYHRLIEVFKSQWETYSRSYGGGGEALCEGMKVALDVLEIQAWMLAHRGKFPSASGMIEEQYLVAKFNTMLQKMAQNVSFAQDPAVRGAVHHVVYLREAAKGAKNPLRVIQEILQYIDEKGRVPGSSLEQVSVEEDALTQELNFVEQLRQANLLFLLVPMEKTQNLITLYLQDFQEKGHIYRHMIKIIPEFGHDATLNVPTRSHVGWKMALDNWKDAHNNVNPRAAIAGRFGLPVNFNDLTREEQTEVLLGTYLRIKNK